ncbi:GNAT family N-acetyltransferase [Clostridium tertium]|uniref:GNAT family N-acetyltransferase n=1 Tax=Clostridium tertium TaxID=1559 RepID=A0A9X3XJ72_9CLOT|nr:GNAT family N-acetyltransferase [Clostridium tertium]MDB1949013.1 GNAT family N-acetyltransferase [Clostridium tertium]MDC4238639.1 GNAT family N-acetyltransferase [Clostridium tertium]
MVGFDVREIKLNDYEDIHKLNSKLDYLNIKSIAEDKRSITLVAQLNDDVIGYVDSNISEDLNYKRKLDINSMIVDEKYRGLGVGYQLILELEKNAKQNEVAYIVNSNKEYNEEELKFFNRQGFELDNKRQFIKNEYIQ